MDQKFLVAGYGLPAEIGITTLFGMGASPDNVALLTYEPDERNAGLCAMAKLRGIRTSVAKARSAEAEAFVAEFSPDCILSLHYRDLLPIKIIEMARLGGANLHPSLLPDYKGTNSVAWAIINGETETGFTFHRLDAKFDTGPILLQRAIKILPDDTAFSLFHRQIQIATPFIGEVIQMLVDGQPGTPQTGEGRYFKREIPFSGVIDPGWSRERVERFVRAMYFPPFPPAKMNVSGVLLPVNSLKEYLRLKQEIY